MFDKWFIFLFVLYKANMVILFLSLGFVVGNYISVVLIGANMLIPVYYVFSGSFIAFFAILLVMILSLIAIGYSK